MSILVVVYEVNVVDHENHGAIAFTAIGYGNLLKFGQSTFDVETRASFARIFALK